MDSSQWEHAVSYVPLGGLAHEPEQRWFKFIEWYDDLVRWVVAASPYGETVGVSSMEIEEWLWTTGANDLFENADFDIVAERLDSMPEFPREWPAGHDATMVQARLSALAKGTPLKMQEDAFLGIARGLRQQAIKLLELVELAAEAPEGMAVERAEAAASARL